MGRHGPLSRQEEEPSSPMRLGELGCIWVALASLVFGGGEGRARVNSGHQGRKPQSESSHA